MNQEKLAIEHGLSKDEYKDLVKKLGRLPDLNEIGVFSALWSEHCSYKSSRVHLKRLHTEGAQVIQGPGENAGVVDIGDGECICFKMESHNHPSYIEPFQGAATGVGGILRDVFTMGARPIALLDLLRFGQKDSEVKGKSRHVLNGVVKGIAHYGNCMGVPTVGGDTFFHERYLGNPLVNAMCVGYVKKDKIFKGYAEGIGNPLMYVGAKTGRDGIHGASMSSGIFTEGEDHERSTVQVGDPFTEKLLLEACLELMKKDVIVGIQDMGAAGISSSSFEMAERAGTGIVVDFDKVPVRAKNMTPYELMLSESQERMLLVAKKGKEKIVGDIFDKWGLDWASIGEVIKEKVFRGNYKGKKVFKLPISLLSGDMAPKYDRAREENKDRIKRYAIDPKKKIARIKDEKEGFKKLEYLLKTRNIASKKEIFQQYDYMVRTNTVIHPGWDGALLRIKGGKKAIGLSVASKNRWCEMEPFLGGAYSSLDAAMNIAVMGTLPLAITDCLNFGSPEDPQVMNDFARAIDGVRDISKTINMPVVSGNVSFYNQTDKMPILPTPAIGAVGLINDFNNHISPVLKNPGSSLYLVSLSNLSINGSEYMAEFYKEHEFNGPLPLIDFNSVKNLIKFLTEGKTIGLIESAHDVGLGGVGVELSKMIIYSNHKGFGINVDSNFIHEDFEDRFFGEAPCSVIIETKEDSKLIDYLNNLNIQNKFIGKVTNQNTLSLNNLSLKCFNLYKSFTTKL
jgi:phosphoribosylformylglycinamidine synthase subunit PurL